MRLITLWIANNPYKETNMKPKITILWILVVILLTANLIQLKGDTPSASVQLPCNCHSLTFKTPAFTITKHSVKKVIVDPSQWTFPQNASLVFTNHQDNPLPEGLAIGGYEIGFDGTLSIRFVNPGPTVIEVSDMTWFSNRIGIGLD